jgi:hypothetical protein
VEAVSILGGVGQDRGFRRAAIDDTQDSNAT